MCRWPWHESIPLTAVRAVRSDDFTAYADVCFRSFGDRVKHWITVNEPNIEPIGGYDQGYLPPRRCSYPFGLGVTCTHGNSTTEPYAVAHHLLLAHASAVSLYRRKYQVGRSVDRSIDIHALQLHYINCVLAGRARRTDWTDVAGLVV